MHRPGMWVTRQGTLRFKLGTCETHVYRTYQNSHVRMMIAHMVEASAYKDVRIVHVSMATRHVFTFIFYLGILIQISHDAK